MNRIVQDPAVDRVVATVSQIGGARRDRTADLLHAMQALSQLSYGPTRRKAGKFIRLVPVASSCARAGIGAGRIRRQANPYTSLCRVLFKLPADLRGEPADQGHAETAVAAARCRR